MRFPTVPIMLLALLAARPIGAAVVEVPIPGLVGTYVNQARTATFHLPALPGSIHSVALRVHGTSTYGTYDCGGAFGQDTVQAVTQINAEFDASPGIWAAGRNLFPPGEFGWTQSFGTQNAATWGFMLDGTAELWLSGSGIDPYFECSLVGPPPTVTLDEVVLLVDGDFPTPAARPSWGRVKSMYR